MEYTKNYHLPQWKEDDRIMMRDFNDAMESIEEGVSRAQKDVSEAYTPNRPPYVVGTYQGSGAEMTITLGFRPSFLIISGSETAFPTGTSALGTRELITGGNTLSECVTFTDTGFILHKLEDNVSPKLVVNRQKYDYIAFR